MKYILSILITLSFLGCNSNKNLVKEGVTIRGKISLKGSMPHTYLTIKEIASNKEYKIINKSDFNLQQLQNHTITIEAQMLKDALGPGFPATIKVIKVKNKIAK